MTCFLLALLSQVVQALCSYYLLYSNTSLLVKHSDLLALTEAHFPRPNNCKTAAKKLFEFVSQAKKDIIKHFYCGYCNTYYGRDVRVEDCTEVNKTCSICGRRIPEDSSFFVEVPIGKQLQKFFSSK